MGWAPERDGPHLLGTQTGYGQLWALRMNGNHQAQTIGGYLKPYWTLHPFPKEESPGLEL